MQEPATQEAVSGAPVVATPAASDRRLRFLALPILFLTILEVFVGNALAEASSYPVGTLALHVGFALLLVGLTGHAVGVSIRRANVRARFAALLTFGATVGTTIAGAIFLWGGGSPAALDGMEGLPVLILIGVILLVIWGSVAVPVRSN